MITNGAAAAVNLLLLMSLNTSQGLHVTEAVCFGTQLEINAVSRATLIGNENCLLEHLSLANGR